MTNLCPACKKEAETRDTKVLMWITCEDCGIWGCATELYQVLVSKDQPLAKKPLTVLNAVLKRDGYGEQLTSPRVLLYQANLPAIAPLVNVVPVHLDELSDSKVLTDGRLEQREAAFRGDYSRTNMLLNPGAFSNNRYILP